MKALMIALALFCVGLSACKKKTSSGTLGLKTDYFAFGDSYGMCVGDCTHFFLLEDDKLYPDDMERITNPWQFSNEQLSDEKRDKVKLLLDKFPDYLKTTSATTIGCPDCHDQGGFYIQYQKEGVGLKKIIIDTDQNAQPEEIKEFVKELSETIDFLKK